MVLSSFQKEAPGTEGLNGLPKATLLIAGFEPLQFNPGAQALNNA